MITGATSGIGVAVIREFLSLYSGCYFILVSRNRKRMRERIESDSDIKDRIRYEIVETDLCDLHKSEEILEPRIREKGRVDILKVHAKDVLMDETVDFDEIALATSGAVGSDLAHIQTFCRDGSGGLLSVGNVQYVHRFCLLQDGSSFYA